MIKRHNSGNPSPCQHKSLLAVFTVSAKQRLGAGVGAAKTAVVSDPWRGELARYLRIRQVCFGLIVRDRKANVEGRSPGRIALGYFLVSQIAPRSYIARPSNFKAILGVFGTDASAAALAPSFSNSHLHGRLFPGVL
jgi:hypothetical protein